MECKRSQDPFPRAVFEGGHWGFGDEEDFACLRAAERADMVSSQAGRSQSSRRFLELVKPLEGSDFLNFSKSSIPMAT